MEPGRELDAWLAEHAFGYDVTVCAKQCTDDHSNEHMTMVAFYGAPHYHLTDDHTVGDLPALSTTDEGCARLERWLEKNDYGHGRETDMGGTSAWVWKRIEDVGRFSAGHETKAGALALATYRALGGDDG